MLENDRKIILVQGVVFLQDLGRHHQFADIVQQTGHPHPVGSLLLEAGALGQGTSDGGHPAGVGRGEPAAKIDDSPQHLGQGHEVAAPQVHPPQGETLLEDGAHGRGDQVEPEGLPARHLAKGLHKLGHKPLPGTGGDHLDDLALLAQNLALRRQLHRDAVGEVDEMTEQRHLLPPLLHPPAREPGNVVKTDDPGQVGKRGKARQQGRARQGVAVGVDHLEFEGLQPGLERQAADIMDRAGQGRPPAALLVPAQGLAKGGGQEGHLVVVIDQHPADQVSGGGNTGEQGV